MGLLARIAFSLLLAAGFGFGCSRPGSASAKEGTQGPRRVVLQTDWFPQAEHGGFYQAQAKGFYTDAGLAVEIWPGGPGAGIKLKVARGDAEFGMLRSDDIILSASRGMPLVMVAATMQHDPMALMVHASSPVRSFQDLDGRAVIGNVGMTYFPFLEKRYGIRIEKRQNTYGLGEFLANTDTIQQCMLTNEPFFARQRGREVRTLPLADSGFDCYHVVFSRRDFVRGSPEVVAAFVRASIRGWRDYLEQDPAPAHDAILQRNREMTPELLAFSRSEMIAKALVRGDPARGEHIGHLSKARIADEIATLQRLQILEAPVRVDDVVWTADE